MTPYSSVRLEGQLSQPHNLGPTIPQERESATLGRSSACSASKGQGAEKLLVKKRMKEKTDFQLLGFQKIAYFYFSEVANNFFSKCQK